MNIPIYNADVNSKKIVSSNLELKSKLIEILGEDCYINGELNRKKLANFIFSSDENRLLINSIIHPYVLKDFLKWSEEHSQYDIVGMESAILFESGFNKYVDKVVMVYAPLEIRINRTMSRDNSTREEVLARISAQMDDEQKRALSHYIINNGGDNELLPQINGIINKLLIDFR